MPKATPEESLPKVESLHKQTPLNAPKATLEQMIPTNTSPIVNVMPNTPMSNPTMLYHQMPGLQQYMTVPNTTTTSMNPAQLVNVPGLSYPFVYNQHLLQQVNAYRQPRK